MEEYSLLLVDDEPAVAELTAESINKHSDIIDITIENNPENVIQYGLTTGDIDCILCDFDMPKKNGLDVLAKVREINSAIPFILYTGKGSEEIASKAISEGVTDYMQKSTGDDHYLMLTNRIHNAIKTYHSKLVEQNSIKNQTIKSVQEVIATPTTDIYEKIEKILKLGSSYVGVSSAFLSHITDDTLHIVEWYNDSGKPSPINECPLDESYCQHTLGETEPLVIEQATGTMYEEYGATEEINIESYIGSPVYVNDSYYGTICFIDTTKTEFTESDRQFIGLIGKWIGYELTQHSIKKQLETTAEQSEQFSKMLSHDLKNIFNVTQGYADLLANSDNLSKKEKTYAQKIIDSMDRVTTITENIKILNESDGKISQDSLTNVSVKQLLQESWGEFCGEMCDSKLEIDSGLDTTTVHANKSLFKQALGNILLNAVEHNDTTITISISGTYDETGALQKLHIKDNGSGFDGDPQEYISPTKTTKRTGGGIGLYIVQKVCQHHLWSIEAQNHEDGGAEFTISFNPDKSNLDKSLLSNTSSSPTID